MKKADIQIELNKLKQRIKDLEAKTSSVPCDHPYGGWNINRWRCGKCNMYIDTR